MGRLKVKLPALKTIKHEKIICLVMLACNYAANAQTVIHNNYETSPATEPEAYVSNTASDTKEMISAMAFSYYSFDGFDNYGLSDYFIKPNGLGGEFNIRMSFERYGNYNLDIAPNYSVQLVSDNDIKLLLSLAVGPSLRIQSVSEQNGREIEDKTKVFCDGVIHPYLTFKYKRFFLTGGYFLWGPKFKFGEDYRADGFTVSAGVTF